MWGISVCVCVCRCVGVAVWLCGYGIWRGEYVGGGMCEYGDGGVWSGGEV